MNSVFSAFKSSKADSKQKFANKKITQDSSYENLKHIREIGSSAKMSNFVDDDDDDDTSSCSTQTIRLSHRCKTPLPSPITERNVNDLVAATIICGKDTVDYVSESMISINGDDQTDHIATVLKTNDIIENNHNGIVENSSCSSSSSNSSNSGITTGTTTHKAISASESNLCDSGDEKCFSEQPKPSPCSSLRSFPTASHTTSATTIPKVNFSSEGDILSSFGSGSESIDKKMCNCSSNSCVSCSNCGTRETNNSVNETTTKKSSLPACSSQSTSNISSTHAPIIIAPINCRGNSESNLSATSKTTRFQKRLSLSGFTNNSMPSVHGRPSSGGSCGNASGTSTPGGETKKTRLSTHQRNLSLDFR